MVPCPQWKFLREGFGTHLGPPYTILHMVLSPHLTPQQQLATGSAPGAQNWVQRQQLLGLEMPNLGLGMEREKWNEKVGGLGLETPNLGLETPNLGLETPNLGLEIERETGDEKVAGFGAGNAKFGVGD